MGTTFRIGQSVVTPRLPQAFAGPAQFEAKGSLKTGVKEASDVVALPGGRFLVAGDVSAKLGIVSVDGRTTKLDLGAGFKKPSDFEGVAFDPVRGKLFVAREGTAEILRYSWKGGEGDKAKLESTFKLEGAGGSNKGCEGLAYLPGALSPTQMPQLLALMEGKPKGLLLLNDSGSGTPSTVKLDKALTEKLKDFSGVAVDPRTGHVFISSDVSSAVAQVKLTRQGRDFVGTLVQVIPVGLSRMEGVTFDDKGNLHVLTENDGKLHTFERR